MLARLLHQHGPRALAAEARRLTTKYWRRLRRHDRRVVKLSPPGRPRGRVLFSYILDPLLDPGASVSHDHTHFWESLTMAGTFAELGWTVDAISWTNQAFHPQARYDVVVDVRLNLERLAPELGPDTVKLLHTDTAHVSFHNPAQRERYRRLAERRGRALRPQRELPENRAIETADCCTYLGNDFTRETYAFAGKPLFRIPVSVPFAFAWPAGKDWERARRRYLWFGSGGLVHKGLDLVLEAFAGLPGYELVVCGPIRRERDFEREYFRELYQTPNIRTLGWIDIGTHPFLELARSTLGVVYPSCAEGGGASVLTCMHAALVPIATREASVDLAPERGVTLRQATVEAIREAVQELSGRPTVELEATAHAAWEWVRTHHTRELFARRWRRFAERLLDGSWQDGPGPEDR